MSIVKLPQSLVERFVAEHPSDQDLDYVIQALDRIHRGEDSGIAIPFHVRELRETYVTWTEDRKWRIIFQRAKADGINVLAIDREQ